MNNRLSKKITRIEHSFDSLRNSLKQKNNSKTLGSYTWSFLYIELSDDKDLPQNIITDTFLHEYIHFLQNISTYYFITSYLFDLNDLLCKINGLRNEIKNDSKIKIPHNHNSSFPQNETYRDFRSYVDGTTDSYENVKYDAIRQTKASEDMDGLDTGLNFDVNIYYIQTENIHFGAKAIAESMAAIAEQIIFKKKQNFPAFPYLAALRVAQIYCPNIQDNMHLLFACCDIALMTPNPAEKFINMLEKLKYEKNIDKYDYHQLYKQSEKDEFELTNGQKGTILSITELSCKNIKNVINDFLGVIDKDMANTIITYIDLIEKKRTQNMAFLTDAIKENKILELYSEIRPPMIIAPSGTYTTLAEDNIFKLFSLYAVNETISLGNCSCSLYGECIKAKKDLSKFDHDLENCQTQPWANIKYNVCPYADVWNCFFGDAQVEID